MVGQGGWSLFKHVVVITGNRIKQSHKGQINFLTNSVVIVKPRSLSCLKTSGSNYAMLFYTVACGPRCLRTLVNTDVEGEA